MNIWSSVTSLFILVASLNFCSISTAGELLEFSINKVGSEYRLRIVSVLDAPEDYVYQIITDYKHAYRINPSITEVEILPSKRDEVVRVRNLSEHNIGLFSFKISWVGDVVETKHGSIEITTIPEFSSFDSGSALWEIHSRGKRTWVLHESRLKPNFPIPPVIGDYFMKKHMEEETLTTFNRIECHAQAILDRDMAHESEYLVVLLEDKGKCVQPHRYEDNLALENQ